MPDADAIDWVSGLKFERSAGDLLITPEAGKGVEIVGPLTVATIDTGSGAYEIQDASTTVKGLIELANNGEALSGGADTTRAITPSTMEFVAKSAWFSPNQTWTYASASTFTLPGDHTGLFEKGLRIKWTQTTVKYGVVVGSSYAAPTTTVTIAVNTDYTIANAAISANYYSRDTNPQGHPGWFNFTPTYGGLDAMTFTSVTKLYAKYFISGTKINFMVGFYGTTGGTASGAVYFVMPVARGDATTWVVCGCTLNYDSAFKSGMMQFNDSSLTDILVRHYDGGNWGLGSIRYVRGEGFYNI